MSKVIETIDLTRRFGATSQKVGRLKKAKVKREINEEIDLLDTMFSSLVELLEEKSMKSESKKKYE